MKNFLVKKIIVAFLALFMAGLAFAQIPSTDKMYEIMDEVVERENFGYDISCTLSLLVEKPNKPKEALQFKVFRRDSKDQTTIVQLAPEADKGAGYLQEKENLWFYDPIAHQFKHSSIKRNLSNSDVKMGDVNKKSKFRKAWEIIKTEEAKLGKYPVFVITAKALE